MQSIAELPESVRSAVEKNPESEAALWAWVSEQHDAAIVEQNRGHLLGKVLRDEFTLTTDHEGRATKVTHPAKKTKGSYRRGSMVDLDATFRLHGDKSQLGYNANIAVSIHFVRAINAMPGAAPDSTGVANLLANQKEHLGVQPAKFIYDRSAELTSKPFG